MTRHISDRQQLKANVWRRFETTDTLIGVDGVKEFTVYVAPVGRAG